MEIEVKQRNRRRKRAQRMQQQLKETKVSKANLDESEAEDVIPKKPPRPPNRRKKQKELQKEPLCEEDIVDGFAILQFRSYEDLELVLKISTKENLKRLTEIERPKLEPKAHITNHLLPLVHNTTTHHGLTTLSHDPATSDDSGRASERLTGSSVAPRDADSSRDRLSDASSRCSSGKGYICDSEGEDDKGSDASSVIFASTPASRKHEFPGALPPSLPHGTSTSPVPAPTPPNLPVPSPAPAQLPPTHPPQAIPSAAVSSAASTTAPLIKESKVVGGDLSKAMVVEPATPIQLPTPATIIPQAAVTMPSVPAASMPQPAAAAPVAHHPSALESGTHPGAHAMRTDSPAVATSANAAVAPSPGQYHHSYQPHQPSLYAPYAHAGTTPYTTSGTPYTNTATPYTNSSTPYTSSTAPYTSSSTHYTNNSTPYTSSSTPYSTSATVTAAVPPSPAIVSTGPPLQPAVASVGPSHLEREKQLRPPSPMKVLSPSTNREGRERESYSVSSLSRSSVATTSHTLAPPTTAVSSSLSNSLSKPTWPVGPTQPVPTAAPSAAQVSPVPPRPTPPLHSSTYPAAAPPIFATPMAPPPVSTASPLTAAPPTNPNPFSAESLFQTKKHPFTDQADMLRRELDNRFLASQDRSLGVAPPPYLRTEMHQHQHHHTHVHQHTTSLLPPPAASSLFPSQLSMSPMERLARRTQSSFKDIPKLGGVDSPFYRQNLGMPNYPGYTPGLIGHPGLTTGPTPFAPPNHLPTFQPKSVTSQDPSKPKILKTGKWNAMHVRVAWEIYHHQQKSGEAKGSVAVSKAASDLLRSPTHLFSPSVHSTRPPHEMSPFPPSLGHRPPVFDQPHHPGSLFTAPPGHLGKSPFTTASSISPFTRYGGGHLGATTTSPFSVNPFATRESHLGLGPLHHDPWRLQRSVPGFPPSVNPLPPTLPGLPPPGPAPWQIKPDPVLEQREREAREREERERERLRREREERERREREEKQRRLEQQQQQERERERREKERREMERRELEKRERERELLLHQQRMAESAKQQLPPPVIRDRSPMRNGQADISEIRVKEEPRTKEEEHLLARTDPRYHPFLRHPSNLQPPPPSVLDRSRMLAHALPPHYPAPASHWPPPTDPYYRYGYNPLMDAMRAQEERDRANFFSAYGHHPGPLRAKDPSLLHLRGGPGPPPPPSVGMPPGVHKMSSGTPPTELHKKEEPR